MGSVKNIFSKISGGGGEKLDYFPKDFKTLRQRVGPVALVRNPKQIFKNNNPTAGILGTAMTPAEQEYQDYQNKVGKEEDTKAAKEKAEVDKAAYESGAPLREEEARRRAILGANAAGRGGVLKGSPTLKRKTLLGV